MHKSKFETVIAFIGLFSLAMMFIGTAVGVLFFGFLMGFKILIASFLVLIFCVIVSDFK